MCWTRLVRIVVAKLPGLAQGTGPAPKLHGRIVLPVVPAVAHALLGLARLLLRAGFGGAVAVIGRGAPGKGVLPVGADLGRVHRGAWAPAVHLADLAELGVGQ